jgi:hypothetical protein
VNFDRTLNRWEELMMRRYLTNAVLFLALQAAIGPSVAAPQQYSFSTFANPTGSIGSLFASTASVSGTFTYDSAALSPGVVGGATIYGTYGPSPSFTPTEAYMSFTSLAGSVLGASLSFSDAQGVATVANDVDLFGYGPIDRFQFSADSSNLSHPARNLSGFDVGGYTLVNVRLDWAEGYLAPEEILDFLSDDSLPSAPPSFHGRLTFDFVNAAGEKAWVDFNGLTVTAVPEPETYAMLLASLGFLGWRARRRKRKHSV